MNARLSVAVLLLSLTLMKLDVIGLVRFVVAVRVKYGTAPALLFACVIRANWHDAHVGAPASYVFRGGEDVGLVFLPGATVEPAAYAPLLKRVAEEARATVILARPAFRSPVLFGGAKAFRALAASDPDVRTWVVGGHSVRFLRPSSSQPRRRRDPPPRNLRVVAAAATRPHRTRSTPADGRRLPGRCGHSRGSGVRRARPGDARGRADGLCGPLGPPRPV